MKINQDRKQKFLYYVLDDINLNGWSKNFFDSYSREGIFTNNEIFIEQNSYFFKSHEIKIGAGCASIPQVGLA